MKNWKLKVLSGTLALSVLLPTTAFAANTLTPLSDSQNSKQFLYYQKFDQEKCQQRHEQLLDLVTKYTPNDLTEWKNAIAERERLVKQLREQRPQLSDEVREKVKAIHEDMRNGKITQEQAQAELKKLGIERTDRPYWPELPAEIQKKVNAIREDVKNGKLTKEQAKEELKKLGLKDKYKNVIWQQFDEAVKANDEAKIKELLPKMLKQMQDKNKTLKEKLTNISK